MSEELLNILMPIGALLMLVGLVMMVRKRRKRRVEHRQNPQPSLRLVRAEQEHRMRRDIEEVTVEFHEIARQASAQLDQKTIMLEKAIRDADERNAQLKATLAQLNKSIKN